MASCVACVSQLRFWNLAELIWVVDEISFSEYIAVGFWNIQENTLKILMNYYLFITSVK